MQPEIIQSSDYPQSPSSTSIEELTTLIQRQIAVLENINKNLTYSMELHDDNRRTLRTRVIDVDMSIGAMISFMFKWLIASIPVGIVVGIVWFVLAAIFAI